MNVWYHFRVKFVKKALIGRIQLALSVVEQTEKSDAKIISKMANENEARTFL